MFKKISKFNKKGIFYNDTVTEPWPFCSMSGFITVINQLFDDRFLSHLVQHKIHSLHKQTMLICNTWDKTSNDLFARKSYM